MTRSQIMTYAAARHAAAIVSVTLALSFAGLATGAEGAQGVPQPPGAQQTGDQSAAPMPALRMPDAIRSAVNSVVVIAGQEPVEQNVSGTYDQHTDGLIDGMINGSDKARIHKEVGPVPVNIPIPILRVPMMIFGGISGATKRQIQDFRDAMTKALANAENQTIDDRGLALDVFWGLRKLPDLHSKLFAPTVPIPADTDAVLYVSFDDIGIKVEGKEAVITTAAAATLRSVSTGQNLYETKIYYQDRDTLGNWTDNGNALWRDYANYARHYLGRALAADLFDRVYLAHELQPIATDTASPDRKNPWHFESRSQTPTLAWELNLADVPAARNVDAGAIHYDIEIYDAHQLVYDAQAAQPSHMLAMELECGSYRWSVRPSYQVDGETRFGEWMRRDPETGKTAQPFKGMFGREASLSPAYTQDFAVLDIECK